MNLKSDVTDWAIEELQLCDDLLWRNGLIIASFGQEELNRRIPVHHEKNLEERFLCSALCQVISYSSRKYEINLHPSRED